MKLQNHTQRLLRTVLRAGALLSSAGLFLSTFVIFFESKFACWISGYGIGPGVLLICFSLWLVIMSELGLLLAPSSTCVRGVRRSIRLLFMWLAACFVLTMLVRCDFSPWGSARMFFLVLLPLEYVLRYMSAMQCALCSGVCLAMLGVAEWLLNWYTHKTQA